MKQGTRLLQERQLPRFLWDIVTQETSGNFLTSCSGNKYLTTLMDVLTSYPKDYPS